MGGGLRQVQLQDFVMYWLKEWRRVRGVQGQQCRGLANESSSSRNAELVREANDMFNTVSKAQIRDTIDECVQRESVEAELESAQANGKGKVADSAKEEVPAAAALRSQWRGQRLMACLPFCSGITQYHQPLRVSNAA